MSAVQAPKAPPPGGATRTVSASLARRSLQSILRMPSAFVPSLIFPIFTTIAFSNTFGAITNLPFFPTDNAYSWFVPLAGMQGAGFVGLFTALGVVRDFEDGFINRLLLAPTSRRSLMFGPLLSATVRVLMPVFLVLIVGVIGGMAMPAGPVLAVTFLLIACFGISFSACCWGLGLAFRFRSMRAAPLMQVGLFFAIFLSTSQMPLEGLSPWLETVARLNPTTYILQLGRQGFLGDITWAHTWPGLLAIVVMGAGLFWFAVRGLRRAVP